MNFKYNYDRKFIINIHGDKWQCYLVTDDELAEQTEDETSHALISFEEKCIFFSEIGLTKGVVAHELLHLYIDYMCLGSADINTEQFEEIICEFLQYKLDLFVKTRNKIFNKLKKLI